MKTSFQVDAAMDILLPRRGSVPMPRTRHQQTAARPASDRSTEQLRDAHFR